MEKIFSMGTTRYKNSWRKTETAALHKTELNGNRQPVTASQVSQTNNANCSTWYVTKHTGLTSN